MKSRFTNSEIELMLRKSGNASLSAEAKQRIESVLRNSITTASESSTLMQAPLWFRPAFVVSLVIVVLLTSGIGTAFAANNSKPGDILFVLDTAIERFAFSIAATPAARARISAQIAEERSKELTQLQEIATTSEFTAAADNARTALQSAEKQFTQTEEQLSDASFYATASILDSTALQLNSILAPSVANEGNKQLTKAIITLHQSNTFVEIVFQGVSTTFTIESNDANVAITEISHRTGVDENIIRSLAEIYNDTNVAVNEDNDVHTPTQTPAASLRNTNRRRVNKNSPVQTAPSTTKNANAAANLNSNATNREAAASVLQNTILNIRVTIKSGQSEVVVVDGTNTTSWKTDTTEEGTIASEIAARIGVTPSQVRSIWKISRE